MTPIPNWMVIARSFTSTVKLANSATHRIMKSRRRIAPGLNFVTTVKFAIIRVAAPSATISK